MARKTKPKDAMRRADLRVASATIGETGSERLMWVVEFSQEDPARWHSAERSARGDCLIALAHGGFPESLIQPTRGVFPDPLPRPTVDQLQSELRAVLAQLVTAPVGVPVKLPIEGSSALVRATVVHSLRDGKNVGHPAIFGSTSGHRNVRSAVFQALRDLILSHGTSLLACANPKCRAPFVKTHKQVFHSKDCAQRHRNDKRPPRPRKRG
jgi:hypothetical protein